jgi:dinuclear metal center YbgI/SA1388 family protein
MSERAGTLGGLVQAMEALAPRAWAGDWDNVGLLIQARPLEAPVARVLVAIDLNRPVMDEALGWGADAVVAYHPPIFRGLKRLTWRDPQQRLLLDAIQAGISVYSPHTALDAAPGGVCDWLAEGLGVLAASVPIEPPRALPPELEGRVGAGRIATLAQPVDLETLVARAKAHLGLAHLRLAAAPAHAGGAPVRAVALCPGAGGSLFEKLPRSGPRAADLFLTGELRHHDVLSRVASGQSVILTDHTNTERGYLPTLAANLGATLDAEIRVSAIDRDPLVVV